MDSSVTTGLRLLEAGLVAIPLWLAVARIIIKQVDEADELEWHTELLLHSLIICGYGSLVMLLDNVLELVVASVPPDNPLVKGILWIRVLFAVAGWVLWVIVYRNKSLKYSVASILLSGILAVALFELVKWDMLG